jgi:hypothetical protein
MVSYNSLIFSSTLYPSRFTLRLRSLSLPLFVTGVFADNPDNAFAFHDLAFNANFFYAGSYFHFTRSSTRLFGLKAPGAIRRPASSFTFSLVFLRPTSLAYFSL